MKKVALILLAGVGTAFGQTASEPSLGEVARIEKERRALKAQAVQRTGKTITVKSYTQDDIKTAMSYEEPEVAEPGKETASASSSEATPDPAAEAAAKQEAEKQQWRAKADAIRSELAAAEREQRALETDMAGQTIPPNALLYARDRVTAAKQRLAQLEEDARRVGVPPGWVR
jgi:hypothetical protein